MTNQEEFASVIEDEGITKAMAAKIMSAASRRTVSYRRLMSWTADTSKPSSREFPDWAIYFLKKGIEDGLPEEIVAKEEGARTVGGVAAVRFASVCHKDDDISDRKHRRVRLQLHLIDDWYRWYALDDDGTAHDTGIHAPFHDGLSAAQAALVHAFKAPDWGLRAYWHKVDKRFK